MIEEQLSPVADRKKTKKRDKVHVIVSRNSVICIQECLKLYDAVFKNTKKFNRKLLCRFTVCYICNFQMHIFPPFNISETGSYLTV